MYCLQLVWQMQVLQWYGQVQVLSWNRQGLASSFPLDIQNRRIYLWMGYAANLMMGDGILLEKLSQLGGKFLATSILALGYYLALAIE